VAVSWENHLTLNIKVLCFAEKCTYVRESSRKIEENKMHKTICIVFLMIATIPNLRSNSYQEQNSASPNSVPVGGKGYYELYSWQRQGIWIFTLISGTNRSKSVSEITTRSDIVSEDFVKLRASTIEELTILLSRLRKEAFISWSGVAFRTAYPSAEGNPFAFPPRAIVNSIVDHCKQLNIRLSVTP
jgi:hypothetical protein